MSIQIVVRNSMTRERVAKHFTEPSLAKQSFAKECDINNIMRKFEKQGLIDHVNQHQGQYGNYIGFQDYQTSLNQILEAENAFSTIPSKVRAIFSNDPVKFLEFAQNPDNLDEMIEMGLAPPRPTEPGTGEVGPGGTPPPTPADPTPPPPPAPGEPPQGAATGATG